MTKVPGALRLAFLLLIALACIKRSALSILSDLSSLLVDPRQTVLKKEQPQQQLPWRVLNFGTSVSWGATLKDPEHTSFPHLLSPIANNLAMRAQGPRFPSVCTQTLVGNEAKYDLITLEFNKRAEEGLELLVKRLRQRFPDAVIVIVRRWSPLSFQYGHNHTGLQLYMKENGFSDGALHDFEFHKFVREHTEPTDWNFEWSGGGGGGGSIRSNSSSSCAVQDRAAELYGAHIYALPLLDDPRDSIVNMSNLHAVDLIHMTPEGHEFVANGIRDLLQKKNITIRRYDKVNKWAEKDYCDTWFRTGESSKDHPVAHGNQTNFTMFDVRANKWALEIPSNGDGWMTVINPFDKERNLILMFMGTEPPSIYPKTRAFLQHNNKETQPHDSETIVDLDPTMKNFQPEGHLHVGLTMPLGAVLPGETTIRFQPLEQNKERPFRIIGYAMTGLDQVIKNVKI